MSNTTHLLSWTYSLAMAAAKDAANRRMRAAGRTAWSRGDYNHSVETFERLYPQAVLCDACGRTADMRPDDCCFPGADEL